MKGHTWSRFTGNIHKTRAKGILTGISTLVKEFRKICRRPVRVHCDIRSSRISHFEKNTWPLRKGKRRRKVCERVAKGEFLGTFILPTLYILYQYCRYIIRQHTHTYIYIHIFIKHTHTYTHIYIYIYIYTQVKYINYIYMVQHVAAETIEDFHTHSRFLWFPSRVTGQGHAHRAL